MSGKSEFRKAISRKLGAKADRPVLIPGLLGAVVGGLWQVNVPGRTAFVYVRVHGSQSEIIEAFNDTVSPILDLAVVLTRDELTPQYYRILRRDTPKYPNWTAPPQLAYHALQHTFGGSGSAGQDILWVQKQQFVPLEVRPYATTGTFKCFVDPEYYVWNGEYKFFSGSVTPDFAILRPPILGQGLFATVYLDGANGSLGVVTGSVFSTTPWPDNYRDFIPTVSGSVGIPLAGILVSHEMTDINWNQIYDIRALLTNGGAGSSGGGSVTGSVIGSVTGTMSYGERARMLTHGMFVGSAHDNAAVGTERMYLWYSVDGFSWYQLPGNPIGTETGRDPVILSYDNKWWVITTASSNHDYFNLYSSPDLISWSSGTSISCAGATGTTQVWAPKWFVDRDGSVHVLAALTIGGHHLLYELHPTNQTMTTWSTPVAITGAGFPAECIDASLIRRNDTYYLFFKDNTATTIDLATSSSLTSGYVVTQTGDWAGWKSVGEIEGPCVIALDDQRWRIYYTHNSGYYGSGTYYSDTLDPTLLTGWSAPTYLGDISGFNHFQVLWIPGTGDHERNIDAHPLYQQVSYKGVSGGYASLNGNAQVPTVQLPVGYGISQKVVRAHCTTDQSIGTTPGARRNFDTVDEDPDSTITTGASWLFTAPVTGTYSFAVGLSRQNAGEMFLAFYKNGSKVRDHEAPTTGGSWNSKIAVYEVSLNAGDTMYVRIWGAAGTFNSYAAWDWFTCIYSTAIVLGPAAVLNAANTFTMGPQTIQTGADGNKGLVVKGYSTGQSANLIEWQDSSGTLLGGIGFDGRVGLGAAPPTNNQLQIVASWITTDAFSCVRTKLTLNPIGASAASSSNLYFDTWKDGINDYSRIIGMNQLIYLNGAGTIGGARNYYGACYFNGATNSGTYTWAYVYDAGSPYRPAGNLGTIGTMVGYNVGNMGASYITTAYGIYINNQSGAATNYAIYAGTGKVRFGDQVGIGANPTAADQLYVTSSWSDFTATRSNINSLGYCNPSADVGSPYVFYSLVTNAYKLGPYNMYNVTANSAYVLVASVSGTLSYAVAYSGAISLSGATNGGIITNAYVFRANNPGLTAGNVGTIGTLYGFYVNNQGASFVTNAYGIYIENVVNATSKNYAIYSAGGISYHAGYSGFGQPTIPSVLLHAEDQTSTNNALLEVLRIGGRVSGTAVGAAGFGPSITLYAESATNASYRQQAQIDAQWTVATDASRKARLTLSAFDTAAREGLRIEASGSEAIIGMYGVTGTVRASHIADPTGGVVVDTECRAAVVSLLTAIENIGITKTS